MHFSELFFECWACGLPVSQQSMPLCGECAASLTPCPPICSSCRKVGCPGDACAAIASSPVEKWWAGYLLVGRAHTVIKRWKTKGGHIFNQKVLNDALVLPSALNSFDAIVPIPHDWQRSLVLNGSPPLRISKFLSGKSHVPVLPLLRRVESSALGQASGSRLDRLMRNVPFELATQCKRFDAPSSILLVDDIMTTGNTIEAAATAIRALSVRRVEAFSLGFRPIFSSFLPSA